ncbi:MAG: bifunctional tetrahydrofolate synthase/dihydrofolate synthase [Pseudohongiella sp.]|nr:bifunctional tetrahydrofolate synthase/dihydrofolate synthase [Pseudohongiella sp.]
MSDAPDPAFQLMQWLDRIQLLHPQEIDLGLQRVQQVADRLNLGRPAPLVITVTGTNGKGSHVATLEALFCAQGLRVGCYTSPHLMRYNERVCIQGQPVSDLALVEAFDRIEAARGDVSLTYFEFGTLAALLIFADTALDVAVLEVGMGGRLDAVNIVDADIAVVTNIDLDHQEWLGNTRDVIAIEKAGIFRRGKVVVCAEELPPQTLLDAAFALDCPVYLPGRDYRWCLDDTARLWSWQGWSQQGLQGTEVALHDLPIPQLAPGNVASALQAAFLSGLLTDTAMIAKALAQLNLAGRQQWIDVPGTRAKVMVDVAHNPHAATALAERLKNERAASINSSAKVHMVVAMMADKDHEGFYRALENQVDFWYIAHFELARCLPAEMLADKWQLLAQQSGKSLTMQVFNNVVQGFDCACQQASEHDTIVVCGSFITVSNVISALESRV